MKELSIEEKAKRYDEALEKFDVILNLNTVKESGTIFVDDVRKIFPELKESEDEKMKEKLIAYFKNLSDAYSLEPSEINIKKAIAWIEKQGKQKPVFEMKTPEESLGIDSDTYNKVVDECIYGEQKPNDKIKSFDKYEGLTDFERTLADICIGWIGEELGWKEYIKDNADVLLKIANKKFNSVQDVSFDQNLAWNEEDEKAINDIMWIIEAYRKNGFNETHMQIADSSETWLKSIRLQKQWKLSEGHLKALEDAMNKYHGSYSATLCQLYGELEKLKK